MKPTVSMRATVKTDGNDETRYRQINAPMDTDPILQADSLETAIEYFVGQVSYLDEATDFEYFIVDGEQIKANHWEK